MAFNFNKNNKNNLLIIMLLIFVILSCIVYINMSNFKESLENINLRYPSYFIQLTSDSSYNYYKLNNARYTYVPTTPIPETNPPFQLVSTISGSNYYTQNLDFKTYFRTTRTALIGYYRNSDAVSLYKIKPIASTLDISTINNATPPYTNGSLEMLFIENSGNLYDLSDNKLSNFTMKINNVDIIKNGKFVILTTRQSIARTAILADEEDEPDEYNPRNLMSDELFLYLLNKGSFGSSYIPPIYNNFETAMNLPSNPIVNPVNAMNPLEYAQTLFAPQVTPMMVRNAYLNSDTNISQTQNTPTQPTQSTSLTQPTQFNAPQSTQFNAPQSTQDITKFNSGENLLSQNLIGSNTRNSNSSYTDVNDSQKLLKEKCPPCPGPQRCPESNFDCKKVPNYEQGIDNVMLPRPVLADFSTFGM